MYTTISSCECEKRNWSIAVTIIIDGGFSGPRTARLERWFSNHFLSIPLWSPIGDDVILHHVYMNMYIQVETTTSPSNHKYTKVGNNICYKLLSYLVWHLVHRKLHDLEYLDPIVASL